MPPKKVEKEEKIKMSQYNAAFNLYYDTILQLLAEHFYQNEIIDSNSKYGLANFCILRTLFDYVDEIVRDYPYTSEQLVSLIEEHDRLKTKFEQKLIALSEETQEKLDDVMASIEGE
jgi:hypothetical protein